MQISIVPTESLIISEYECNDWQPAFYSASYTKFCNFNIIALYGYCKRQ